VEWQEPLMAAGNWIPELTEMLGAENLFGSAGAHSPWMTWEDILKADADAIVCMPCGYDLKRTRAEMHWHDWTKLRAPVFLADGNQYLNRPGPRVAQSLRILAEILYPESFEPTLEGIGWEKF
jgi:iron complex transport system substrate-binding protein